MAKYVSDLQQELLKVESQDCHPLTDSRRTNLDVFEEFGKIVALLLGYFGKYWQFYAKDKIRKIIVKLESQHCFSIAGYTASTEDFEVLSRYVADSIRNFGNIYLQRYVCNAICDVIHEVGVQHFSSTYSSIVARPPAVKDEFEEFGQLVSGLLRSLGNVNLQFYAKGMISNTIAKVGLQYNLPFADTFGSNPDELGDFGQDIADLLRKLDDYKQQCDMCTEICYILLVKV